MGQDTETKKQIEAEAKRPAPSSTTKPSSVGFWYSTYTFTLMGFLGNMLIMSTRVDLSVAIVAMVNTSGSNTSLGVECLEEEGSDPGDAGSNDIDGGEFNWDEQTQGLILSAYSFGFISTNLVGGMLTEKYGGKWIYGLSVFCSGALGFALPSAARLGHVALVAVRVMQGAFQGPIFPCIYAMGVKWMPLQEKNRLMTAVNAGGQVGLMLGFPLTGVLTSRFGWPTMFYTTAVISTFWFVAWIFLCFDEPAKHPRISEEEKRYIIENAAQTSGPVPFPPLRKIFTSKVYWGMQLAQMGNNWGVFTLSTATPTFLNNIQHVTLEENGIYSALPYAMVFVLSFPLGWLAEKMINSGRFSVTFVRKVFNSIGMFGPAAGLLVLGLSRCDTALAVTALTLGVGCNAGVFTGFVITPTDIAPRFTGSICGIALTVANVMGFTTPLVTGFITDGNQTIAAWQTVFFLAAGIFAAGNIFYLLLHDSEVQPWNFVGMEDEVAAEAAKSSSALTAAQVKAKMAARTRQRTRTRTTSDHFKIV